MPLLLFRSYKIAQKVLKTRNIEIKVVLNKTWERIVKVVLLMDHCLNKKERSQNRVLNFTKKNKNNLLTKSLSLK